jgi:cold-inducible RNA-binding protein
MEKKLYVGGISYSSTEDSLKAAFAKAGDVTSANIITDKVTGRSKGFGFVEMATEDGAQKAIEMYNGKELDGRNISVAEARPKTDRPSGPRREGGFGGGRGGYGDRNKRF